MKTLTLSGWGQPHDALSAIAPDATHVDYAQYDTVRQALTAIAAAGESHEMVIGWSLGGQLAVRAIAQGLLKPKRLVLIGTPFQFVKTDSLPIGLPRDVHDQFRQNFVDDPARTLARAWELVVKDDKEHRKIRAQLGVQDQAKLLAKNWLRWLDLLDGFSCADIDFKPFPPTLLVHGENDAVVRAEQAPYFAKAISKAALSLWKDCGHAPHWHDTQKLQLLMGSSRVFDTQAIQSGFGRAADVYDEYALLQRHVRAHALSLAKPYWKNGAHILDAGGGTGALAREAKHWQVVNLDVSFRMCAVAGKHCRAVNADVQAMPFADAAFDGVFSSLMLQWVNDPSRVLAEMARVLKPKTHIILSTLVVGTLDELQAAFAAADDRAHVSEFLQPHQLLAHAKEAGLTLALARQAPVVEYYPDAIALMRALQAIGATHKESGRRKSLMTPRQFARVENAYEKRRTPQGLPATWQVLYLVLKKI